MTPGHRITNTCQDCGFPVKHAQSKRCPQCHIRSVHKTRRDRVQPPNPSGLCLCGCGQPTPIATKTSAYHGMLIGHPVRYVSRAHVNRTSGVDYVLSERGYETPCWIWQLHTSKQGYGKTRRGQAHVAYYERVHGRLPKDMTLHHLCRVKSCVNPDHMQPMTRSEHSRMHRPGRRSTVHCHCPGSRRRRWHRARHRLLKALCPR